MVNKNQSQIRVGKSGPINIGDSQQESSIRVKIGSSGNEKHKRKENLNIEKINEIEEIINEDENLELYTHTIIKFEKMIDTFNVLVQNNKISGRNWYEGLEGDWWRGISEEEARKIRSEKEVSQFHE